VKIIDGRGVYASELAAVKTRFRCTGYLGVVGFIEFYWTCEKMKDVKNTDL
jgi:hypothetical protein